MYCISKIWGGYRKCRHECSLGVNLVIDNFFMWLEIPSLQPCIKFCSNRTIGISYVMEILHFKDLEMQSVVWLRTQLFWCSETESVILQ